MVTFLLKRPVAVFMCSLALTLLGIVAILEIPTTLLPDIPVPKISVQISYPNNSGRAIETNVTRPIRNQLLQLSTLKNIISTSRDGDAIINLEFEHGTNTDLAFIEVNEKIDAVIQQLPRNLERPKVIKASASDIPVINFSISYNSKVTPAKFRELSTFSQRVIKKRIEQLPDVALADISGRTYQEVVIQPRWRIMESLGITNETIIQAIEQNNFELGNLIVRNGIYQYNLQFSDPLTNIKDLKEVTIEVEGQLLKLHQIADIQAGIRERKGSVIYNGKKAILFSIIRQSDGRMENLKESLELLLKDFEKDYPHLSFNVHQDQTKLLDLSISNLNTSLFLGGGLAILIMFLFLKDFKLPIIIGISVPVSILLSFSIFYIAGITINIISLSGLIMGVGMMIDNAIIVIDNITQKIERGQDYFIACASGTSEMISPLISSVMTTSMIFLPLIFLSGITGTLFFDQALSVSIGLFTSLIVSVTLIPVVYLKIKNRTLIKKESDSQRISWIDRSYDKGFSFFFSRKYIIWGSAFFFIGLGAFLMFQLPYSKLPKFSRSDSVFKINWNEAITLEENESRLISILNLNNDVQNYIAELGEQQFLLNRNKLNRVSEASIYLETDSQESLSHLEKKIAQDLISYPMATFQFLPPPNVFEYIFGNNSHKLLGQVYSKNKIEAPSPKFIDEISTKLIGTHEPILTQKILVLKIKFEELILYKVDYKTLIEKLKSTFDQNHIDDIKSYEEYIPIKLESGSNKLATSFERTMIQNTNGKYIPITNFVEITSQSQYDEITADKAGEFLKIPFKTPKNPKEIIAKNEASFLKDSMLGIRFSGSWNEAHELNNELIFIGIIALFLLYFIMAAQFESLSQPLIILLEIPIDIGGALLFLWLFDQSLNLMGGIGIILMSGIVINDSIIKIHTINSLRARNIALLPAIKEAGKLRLKPIVMTSLTTILAMIPFLFMDGMSAELQKPLALTIIGGLLIGTFISLYFLPMIYLLLNNLKNSRKNDY